MAQDGAGPADASRQASLQVGGLPPTDVFGNPFRPQEPSTRALPGGSVRNLAEAAYVDRLPLLADALEDAGCNDAELLVHLRSPGPHVRGCCAVDLVLGKE